MAQIPISGLPAAGPLNGTEEIPAVQSGTTVKILSGAFVGPPGPPGPPGPASNHINSGGANPTAVYNAADGGFVQFITGTDSVGILSIVTGTGGALAGHLVTVTLAAAFTSQPRVLISPAEANAAVAGAYAYADAMSYNIWYVDIGVIPPSVTLQFNYAVLGSPN